MLFGRESRRATGALGGHKVGRLRSVKDTRPSPD